MIIGTDYFVSYKNAVEYYEHYGYDSDEVAAKIKRGEIHVGKTPPTKPGERVTVNTEGRYLIVTRDKK